MQELFLYRIVKDYTVQIPRIIQKSTRLLNWRVEGTNNVYLTFDDGPTPEITNKVLEILQSFNVKGTFFCIARNVERHPEIYANILSSGMAVGNHTYSHLNGWKHRKQAYVNDVVLAAEQIKSKLFRPPYGKIRNIQARQLAKKFKLIMWDVLSKDYAYKTTPEQCLNNVKTYTKAGSIVVFHDSVKAFSKLEYALPKSIEYLLNKGYNLNAVLE
jgi:peptidoglycan/xylan/chitin deacetylase (PgdA/CDA1 family)